MKWNLLLFAAILVSCKTADVVTQNADGITDTSGTTTYFGAFDGSSKAHAPTTIDKAMSSVPSDENILVSNDVWSEKDGSSRMEVTVWNGTEAALGWRFENNSGKVDLDGAPGFPESYPISADVALGNKGKTAMVVFQSQGRVFYSVYNWTGSEFSTDKAPKQLGSLHTVGYGVPRIDSDPEQADRVVITWASYKGGSTNTPTEEIWAVAGYITGHIIEPNQPYPVSRLGGISIDNECQRPDVSYRNNKGYFSYNFKSPDKKHTIVQQELEWETIAEGKVPTQAIRQLQTSDNAFVFTRIAANKALEGTVEWQVVTSTNTDSIRRIVGYNKMYLQGDVKHLEISNNALIDCVNNHPALAIVDDQILVAWLHESDDCLPDLIEKELLQQRIDVRTGELINEDDYAVINSERMGDQRAICISGYFGNGNAYYGFHNRYTNEVVTKSSYNTRHALNPMITIDNMDITGTATGQQQLAPTTHEVATALTLFPNPVGKDLQIDFQGNWAAEATVAIYNNTGTMVKNLQVVTEPATIDVSDLEPGPFYILVSDPTRQVKQSFMVQ